MTLFISLGTGPFDQAEAARLFAGMSLSDVSKLGLGALGFVLGILFREAISWWFKRAERNGSARMKYLRSKFAVFGFERRK